MHFVVFLQDVPANLNAFYVNGTRLTLPSISKIKQPCKPGSVALSKEYSLSFIWACRHQQALAPYPQEQSEDLRRAASSLAYLDFQLLRFTITAVANCVVGSYPAFSPLPHFAIRRYFLCGTFCQRLVALPLPSR